MRPRRGWHRRRRRGVAEILGAILLIALTIIAGTILWSFRFYTPPATPIVTFQFSSGNSHPAWGDPTDCAPQGTWTYPLPAADWPAYSNDWYDECYIAATGNFSVLNSTELIVSGISATSALPLNEVDFTFVCNNASSNGGTTELVTGSFDSMTWLPGQETQAPADAPSLGYCGSFDAGGWSFMPGLTPANGTLYNRLGFFDPLRANETTLTEGDTFVLYLHQGGDPISYLCVLSKMGDYSWYPASYCPSGDGATPEYDFDDYHGVPGWCFDSETACTVVITYTGTPSAALARIPVTSLAQST
jgi:flagellin-like protein